MDVPTVPGRSPTGSDLGMSLSDAITPPAIRAKKWTAGQADGEEDWTKSFDFDARRAAKRGSLLWGHVGYVAARWPALHVPRGRGDRGGDRHASPIPDVLVYSSQSLVHAFVANLTAGELLLIYSLGSFDGSAFPPWPTPTVADELCRDCGSTKPPRNFGLKDEETSGKEKGAIPSSTEYASTMLDRAGTQVIDSFMETRGLFQKHTTSRAGRMAATSSEAGASGFNATGYDLDEDGDIPFDTESAVDQLEDAAVGSIVEAHVNVVRFFSSLLHNEDSCIPAPYPMYVPLNV